MQQYEYVHGTVTRPGFVMLEGDKEERSFNDMGAQGWMLYPPNGTIAYFYRPLVWQPQVEWKMIDGELRPVPKPMYDSPLEPADKAVEYAPANPRPGAKLPPMPRKARR